MLFIWLRLFITIGHKRLIKEGDKTDTYLDNLLSWIRKEHFLNSFLEWDSIVLGFLLPYQSVVVTRTHYQIFTIGNTNER